MRPRRASWAPYFSLKFGPQAALVEQSDKPDPSLVFFLLCLPKSQYIYIRSNGLDLTECKFFFRHSCCGQHDQCKEVELGSPVAVSSSGFPIISKGISATPASLYRLDFSRNTKFRKVVNLLKEYIKWSKGHHRMASPQANSSVEQQQLQGPNASLKIYSVAKQKLFMRSPDGNISFCEVMLGDESTEAKPDSLRLLSLKNSVHNPRVWTAVEHETKPLLDSRSDCSNCPLGSVAENGEAATSQAPRAEDVERTLAGPQRDGRRPRFVFESGGVILVPMHFDDSPDGDRFFQRAHESMSPMYGNRKLMRHYGDGETRTEEWVKTKLRSYSADWDRGLWNGQASFAFAVVSKFINQEQIIGQVLLLPTEDRSSYLICVIMCDWLRNYGFAKAAL